MRIYIIPLFFVFATIAATGFSEPEKNWAKVAEKCISIAPISDGGVLLLSDEGKIIEINSKGETRLIVLPKISSQEKIQFSDLVVNETKVTFCGAKTQTLYSIDFRNPKNWESLSFKGTLPPKNLGFFRISQNGQTFRLQSLDGNVYLVSASGEAQRLPPKSILPGSAQGENLVMNGPEDPREKNSWKIVSPEGKEILSRTAETPEKNILDLRVLGFDGKGRVIFIEALGKGEKNNKFFLHAVENGKIAASKEIEGPGELLSVKSETLLPDGSVCLVRPDSEGKGVKLMKIDLGK